MVIFFAVTPHKLLKDLALNSRKEGVIPNFSSFQVNSSAWYRGACQRQQRSGYAVNVNKAFITEPYEWTTFVERLIYTVDLLAFPASAAAATTRGSNAFNSPNSMERSKEKPPRKDGIRETYTRIKGLGAAEAPKCKRLQAESKQRAQREAYYPTKEVLFPHLACTNSNKRQWQSTGSRKREWGSGRRHFFLEALALLRPC